VYDVLPLDKCLLLKGNEALGEVLEPCREDPSGKLHNAVRSEMGRKPSAVSTSSFFERKEINVQLSPSRVATPS
jgi:hypothetical protein